MAGGIAMDLSAPAQLPSLREDISLHPGPSSRDGSPAWILHDPGRNRFFQIDPLGFEILSRWGSGEPEAIAASITDETMFDAEPSDIEEMGRFLSMHELVQVRGEAGRSKLKAATLKGRWSKLKWLFHNYLYFRLHLFSPERFLARTYPFVSWLYSSWMVPLMGAIALMGIWLASRQWEAFTHSLNYFFSFPGFILFGLALFISKAVHELGHSYTAYRYGCRVGSIGVVFIVLTPMLYTDASEAWLLTSRKRRMAIGAAGIVAELGLAVLATFFWGFLPDGALRSAALMLATTSWVHTLFINLMPYMRFDGYYLFSDWIGIPNLFDKSFAMGRWWLRETLFGFGDPPPEEWDRRTEWLLIVFAVGVWVYRLILFLGIALLVYHFVFKLLGILLFCVEIGWFVLLPVLKELKAWWALRERMQWNFRTKVVAAVLAAFLAGTALPLSFSVHAPALLLPGEHSVFYAPENAIVDTFSVRRGDRVREGDLLVRLRSPELEFRTGQAERQVQMMRWEIAASSADEQLYSKRLVAYRALETAEKELAGYRKLERELVAIAPFSGRVERVALDLLPGQWVGADSPLLSLVGMGGAVGEGYLFEGDEERIKAGASCIFYPENPDMRPVRGRIREIEGLGAAVLARPELASLYGGSIPARIMRSGALVPEQALYRMFWQPDSKSLQTKGQFRGTLVVEASPESFLWRLWRTAVGVVIRETGF